MRERLQAIMEGKVSEEETVRFLTEITPDHVTEDQLAEAAQVMREFSVPFAVNPEGIVDTCGTGGDGKGTFNFSTAAAFVVAGAGVKVVKHGNRAVSSKSGSADVLEKLGVRIEVEPVVMRQALQEAGIAFLFAPRYHPAMKHVAAARKKLGRKTIFNLLGPLINPARPLCQVVGVYDSEKLKMMAEVLRRLGSRHVLVVHGSDGLDEVTLTGTTQVVELKGNLPKEGEIHEWIFDPKDYGREYCTPEKLVGRDSEHNAFLLRGMLEGFVSPLREVTILNAALALVAVDRAGTVEEGIRLAEKSLDTGKAYECLKKFIEVTNR